MSDTNVQAMDNGPYVIKGPVQLLDGDGNTFETAEGKPVALCRCGHSDNKPFCDGSHNAAGFESECRAE